MTYFQATIRIHLRGVAGSTPLWCHCDSCSQIRPFTATIRSTQNSITGRLHIYISLLLYNKNDQSIIYHKVSIKFSLNSMAPAYKVCSFWHSNERRAACIALNT